MNTKNLKLLRRSLEDTLFNINQIIADKEEGVTALFQVDEGGYTEGYQHLELLLVESKIDSDGDLLIQIKVEQL